MRRKNIECFLMCARPGKDAVLVMVESAYAADLDDPAPHGVTDKKVGFNVLVNLALKGKRPNPPA